jgi:hypothetical protein
MPVSLDTVSKHQIGQHRSTALCFIAAMGWRLGRRGKFRVKKPGGAESEFGPNARFGGKFMKSMGAG